MAKLTQTTNEVEVSVEPLFQPHHSNPINNSFLFSYTIQISNFGNVPVQLLSRIWHIWDANGSKKIVEGEGVVGRQPIIKPGEAYQYQSACNLNSGMGTMGGTYEMLNLFDNSQFAITIPTFKMEYPGTLN